MVRAASFTLTIVRNAMIGASVLVALVGLVMVLDGAPLRGTLSSWLRVASDLVALGLLAGPVCAVVVLNALRVEAEGGRRVAFALAGAVSALVGFVGLGVGWALADAALDAPTRQSLDDQLVAAAVFPLVATFGAAGYLGAWASAAPKPPEWSATRAWLVRALGLAVGCGALLVGIALARGGSSAPFVGAPLVVTLAALTAAFAIRARRASAMGELAGALIGYTAGAIGGLVAAGVLDAWQSPGDPRTRVLGMIFLWPILLASLMVAAGSVVAVAGGFRAAFERARRALA